MPPYQLPPLEIVGKWPAPNYINPVTRGNAYLILSCIFIPIVVLVIGIRVFTRLRISKSFGLDDWLIVMSIFPAAGFAGISLYVEYALGWRVHIWDIEFTGPGPVVAGLKLNLALLIMFSLASSLTKLSMLVLIYRIVAIGSQSFARWILAAGVLIALQFIIFFILLLVQCRPISLYWTVTLAAQPTCFSETDNLLAAGIINTFTDLIVVILPIPTVLGVKISTRETIIIVLLFGAGFIGTCSGAVRTYFTYVVTQSNDASWTIYHAWITAAIELYLSIICASIPATKKFFSRYVPSLLRTPPSQCSPTPVRTTTESSNHRTPKLQSFDSDLAQDFAHDMSDEQPKEPDSNIWVETNFSVKSATMEIDRIGFGTSQSQDDLMLVPENKKGHTETFSTGPGSAS